MARRRKESGFEALIDITSQLPWWVGAILAIVSYIFLHSYAAMDIPVSSELGKIGQNVSKQLFKTLALFGQYLLPALFSIGAVISFVRRIKRSRKVIEPKYQPTNSKTHKQGSGVDVNTKIEPVFEKRTLSPHDNSWSDSLIKSLEWKRFEDLCAGLFSAKGYVAKQTKLGADGGIDLFLFKPGSDKPLMIVQCKAWNSKNVGVKPIRELYGVKESEGAPLAVFMTSSNYTDDARAFARGKHLKLLTGTDLLKLIKELPDEKQSRLLSDITEGNYTTPTCPSCGIKMLIRTSKKGSNKGSNFWGCTNYPRCKQRLVYCAQEQ